MRDLDRGRVVHAKFPDSSGRVGSRPHFAIVLNTKEEIAASGKFEVAVITGNNTIAEPQDLIEVIPGVLAKKTKRCWVACSWLCQISTTDEFEMGERKAYGPFLAKILTQVKARKDRIDAARSTKN